MKDLIQSLYGKLEDWNIEPIILAKAIGIFLIILFVANATKITNKIYLNDIDTSGCHILINRDNDDFSWVTKAFDESEGKRTYSDDIDRSSLNTIAENIENFLYNFK